MSVTLEIFQTWRAPRHVFAKKLAGGAREERALITLFAACLLLFIAQWPRLSRAAFEQREAALAAGRDLADVPSVQALIGINLFTYLFMLPLVLYALAEMSRLVLRVFGARKLSSFGARMALFWALLCVAPVMLFHGLLAGFAGASLGVSVVGGLIALGFLTLWTAFLREASA